ncbi:hypothetical protein EV659_102146 [Rhodothalassium salexigens DSM 2132]|uniref:Protein kinase domain-containing protein n=1 Tax=Rhodothalassium salexigens DSM 2132 TaxID=1188247 RepID=A0A4R2PPQ4_RHOSA|nr:hypothetical protein [Rhodothalassium salexigens]MBB4210704.1 hypothetical protein [Rhodothalassium salexigens DSM 2132]MBK1637905.1 hypothetical protein [Rhodothalassium salexigens DSM 2132]TCP37740.1 hypothetical protein EV659_102146 [Rhodothalassium salexigens DSM 2132]
MAVTATDRTEALDFIEIDFTRPYPNLDTFGGRAFAARDLRRPRQMVYAVIQRPGVPTRGDVFRKLVALPAVNLVNPTFQGVTRVKIDGRQREALVTVIEFPGDKPMLVPGGKAASVPFPTIRQVILPACIRALQALHGRGIYHRNIRPNTVFMSGSGSQDFFLGECVTALPGAGQPSCFEPLERSNANTEARGEGDSGCDIFALGATLLSLFFGETVGQDLTEEQMFEARVNQGSFWALSRGRDIPGALGILLRGMLNDDPEDRWTVRDLSNWLDGAVPTRRSGMRSWALARPVKFQGKMFTDRRMLARAFAEDERRSAEYIRKLDFGNWIQQIVTSELFTEKLERLLDVSPDMDLSASGSSDAKLVARVCAFLDPRGPIRYRGQSFMLDGVGTGLARQMADGNEPGIAAYDDILRGGFLETLVEIIMEKDKGIKPFYAHLLPTMQTMKTLDVGGGVEYALYSQCDGIECLSPKFDGKHVNTLRAALVALDESVAADSSAKALLDRHVMAFIVARGQGLESVLRRIGSAGDDNLKLIPPLMDLLGYLQSQGNVGDLPNLASIILNAFRPVVKDLKSKTRRNQVEKFLKSLEGIGSLSKLMAKIDLAEVTRRDEREYYQAQAQCAKLAHDRRQLIRKVSPREGPILRTGYSAAQTMGYLLVSGVTTFAAFQFLG